MYDNNSRSLGQASAAAGNWFWVSFSLVHAHRGDCADLFTELHHLPLHTSDVPLDGPIRLRRLFLLRGYDAPVDRICLVLAPRDQVDSARKHGPTI